MTKMMISILEMMTDMRTSQNKRGSRSLRIRLAAAAVIAAATCSMRLAARHADGWADLWRRYTNRIWVNGLGRISSLVSFSLVEFLIYGILLAVAGFLVSAAVFVLQRRKNRRRYLAAGLTRILLLAAVIFFLYEGGEDVCFYCSSFSEIYSYGRGDYSTEDLAAVCEKIAEKCNTYAVQVKRDSRGIMVLDEHADRRVSEAMERLGEQYPLLDGWYPRAKGVCFSRLMSKTNMAGIYSAYTAEANYNTEMPPYNIPFTMSHELSHVKGILPENEANFTAYLNCVNAPDPDLVYSGYVTGWVYCGNELYRRDRTRWRQIASELSSSVNLDLNYNTEFWDQFKGKTAERAEKFNDAYLRQAGQSSGVKSYDQVTDLIVSYEQKS